MTATDPETTVRAALEQTGVAYELLECDPELADTAQFCAAYGVAPEDSANTILVVAKSDPIRYAVCVLLATTRLDVNKAVRAKLGAKKASFASAEQTIELTGMAIGGVTPFGLPDGLPIFVDTAVMGRNRIILGGGSRNLKVAGSPALLSALPRVEIVDGLALPR
jgi:prolyl-tRNA editing enzyme YbaK/EbsC (Cys-tRNA(Pro) deacylase)